MPRTMIATTLFLCAFTGALRAAEDSTGTARSDQPNQQQKSDLKKADDEQQQNGGREANRKDRDQRDRLRAGESTEKENVKQQFRQQLAQIDTQIEHFKQEREHIRKEKRETVRRMKDDGKSADQIRKVEEEFDRKQRDLHRQIKAAEHERQQLGEQQAAAGKPAESKSAAKLKELEDKIKSRAREDHDARSKRDDEKKTAHKKDKGQMDPLEKQRHQPKIQDKNEKSDNKVKR
jgi:hypothetical protein